MKARICPLIDRETGVISPAMFGFSVQPSDIWVGESVDVVHRDGFRQDALDALKCLGTPFLSTLASDSVSGDRPNWNRDFLSLCKLVHAKPHLLLNIGDERPSLEEGSVNPSSNIAEDYVRFAHRSRQEDPEVKIGLFSKDVVRSRNVAHALHGKWSDGDYLAISPTWPEIEDESAASFYHFLLHSNRIDEALEERGAEADRVGLIGWGPRRWGSDNYAVTLQHALGVAVALEGILRQGERFAFAALALNGAVQSWEASFWQTPVFYLLQMQMGHRGGMLLQTTVEVDEASEGLPAVGATASVREGILTVSVTNRHFSEASDIEIPVVGKVKAARLLGAGTPNAENSAFDPDAVLPNAMHTYWEGRELLKFTMPPHSMATVTLLSDRAL